MKPQLAPKSITPLTVTVADTLAMTGLGMTKLYELLNDGTLESVKVGRRRLIKIESVRRLVGADQ